MTTVRLRPEVYQRWKVSGEKLADLVEAGLEAMSAEALLDEDGTEPEAPDVAAVVELTRDATPSP